MRRFEGRFAGSRWGTVSGIPGVPVAEDDKTSKPWSFDLKAFLAAVSLVAYIFTQLSDSEQRSDDAVARNAFPKFREFVHRFGEFIDSRTNDTLPAIVLNEIVQRRADGNPAFKLPYMDTWHSWWMYFWQGIDRRPHTMTEVRDALMEFHSIVGSYTNQCVTPIFELPPNLKAEVPAEVKSSLNSFQQRYERFLGEYSQFAKSLSESRPSLNGLPCWFSTPKPLS